MMRSNVLRACLVLLAGGVLAGGCADNELLEDFEDHGVTLEEIARLRYVGSEADFGTTKVRVVVTDRQAIEAVWKLIEEAEPADAWYDSGYREIEFYTAEAAEKPAAVLRVNAGDFCHIAGSPRYYYSHDAHKMRGLFRCEGLHALIMKDLTAEHQRLQARRH
jgi:hypothetical protein